VAKVLDLPFQSTILENFNLNLHKQSLDMLELHMLSRIDDDTAISQLLEAPFSYEAFIHGCLNELFPGK
jgi:hypothetical protein